MGFRLAHGDDTDERQHVISARELTREQSSGSQSLQPSRCPRGREGVHRKQTGVGDICQTPARARCVTRFQYCEEGDLHDACVGETLRFTGFSVAKWQEASTHRVGRRIINI